MVDPLAPYGFLFLIAEETKARLMTDHPGEVAVRWETFEIATGVHANDAIRPLISRYLRAYQLVGWVEILHEDDHGFRVRLRNSDAWAGEILISPKKRREEKKEEDTNREGFEAEIQEVHAHWKVALDQPKSRLGKAIAGHIRARLREDRTVAEIKQAIDGCAASQWHRDNGQIGLSLICRNDEKLIQFMARAPKRKGQSFDQDMGIE